MRDPRGYEYRRKADWQDLPPDEFGALMSGLAVREAHCEQLPIRRRLRRRRLEAMALFRRVRGPSRRPWWFDYPYLRPPRRFVQWARFPVRLMWNLAGHKEVVLEFRLDDLSGAATRGLIARHLAGMRAQSPAESVHALDVEGLRKPGVSFWSAWLGEQIIGCGALKELGGQRGEIKSMRVADQFLGRGFGRAILGHLMLEARARGMKSLWLETGSSEAFIPALRLYESAGFQRCGTFEDYVEDPFSVFMTRTI